MRFRLFTALFLAGSAIASPAHFEPAKRDASAINRTLQRLTNSVNTFVTAVRIRPKGGDQNEARRQTNILLGLARQVVSDARQGSRDIRYGPQVGYLESLNLLMPVTNLGSLITTATNGWTDNNVQEMVKAAGMRSDVQRVLKETADVMKETGDAIVGKLPILDGAGPIASAITQSYISLVDNALKVYSRWF
jgi:hypothetical protein